MSEELDKLKIERLQHQNTELQLRVDALEAELELKAWSDDALPEDKVIEESFPTRTSQEGKHERFAEALRLVGARRSKYALVGLVNWLLARADKAEGANKELEALFSKQHERTKKADKLWQDAHKKPGVNPDLGDLIDWLLARAEGRVSFTEGEVRQVSEALQDVLSYDNDPNMSWTGVRERIEDALKIFKNNS